MQVFELKKIALQVRRDILRQVHACQSGHPGGSLGCADLFVALYFHFMNLKTENGTPIFDMNGTGEDLFFPVKWSYFARFLQYAGTTRLFSSKRISDF